MLDSFKSSSRSHRHHHHKNDPVRDHTPPSSASSSSDGLVNKLHKSYVDPVTGRHVDETIIESTDPATGHRRRKHKRRFSGAGIPGGTSSKGVEDAGYAPPPQAVYPGDSISSVGSRGRRSRRNKYASDSDSDSSGSSRSSSPDKKRSSSLSRALAKIGLGGAAVGAKHKYDDFKRRRSQSRGRKSDHDGATTDASSRASSRWSSRSRSRSKAKDAALVAAGAGLANRRLKKHKTKRRGSSVSSDTSGSDSDSDHHHRPAHHRRHSSSDSGITKEQRERAAKAALATAAIQAIRSRKLPGGMTGEQGIRRVVEAAIASGALEILLERRKKVDEHQRRHMIESIIGGLVTQRIIEGDPSKARSASRGALPSLERHRSRSRGPGLAEVAAGGVALYAGKHLYDKHKRSRSQRRYDSSPERHERPRATRKRSSSFPALLGAVGLGYGANEYRKHRSRSRSRDRRSMQLYRGDRGVDYDHDATNNNRYAVGAAAPFVYPDNPNSQAIPVAPPQNGQLQPVGGDPNAVAARADREEKKSFSELSDDDPDLPEEELSKRRKKKKQRELVSAALAVLGVIGAAQKIYDGKGAHKLRKEMVIEGEMSKEEALKKRRKAKMKEGAALGLAGLALWELYDDGKKAYDVHKDRVCFEDSCRKRHNRVGEHVDVNKRDGYPDGTREHRKQQKQIAEGQGGDVNNPNDVYAGYPQAGAPGYAQGPMGVPAGGPVPAAMPAYPPPPEAAYGIPPAGTYPAAAAAYPSSQPVRAKMKDGRNMTVVYPDHVSLG